MKSITIFYIGKLFDRISIEIVVIDYLLNRKSWYRWTFCKKILLPANFSVKKIVIGTHFFGKFLLSTDFVIVNIVDRQFFNWKAFIQLFFFLKKIKIELYFYNYWLTFLQKMLTSIRIFTENIVIDHLHYWKCDYCLTFSIQPFYLKKKIEIELYFCNYRLTSL